MGRRGCLLSGGKALFWEGKEGEWWGLLRYMANGCRSSMAENGELSEETEQLQGVGVIGIHHRCSNRVDSDR